MARWTPTFAWLYLLLDVCLVLLLSTGYVSVADAVTCPSGNLTCEQECRGKNGLYSCGCRAGFKLDADGYSCEDIDECESPNKCTQTCNNTIGSYKCDCFEDYELMADGVSCVSDTVCKAFHCDQTCEITRGYGIVTATCSCEQGYIFDPRDNHTCTDIDECALGTAQCDENCINTNGSYSCSCGPGEELQADGLTCRSILPCPANNSCSDMCGLINGNIKCDCPKGKIISTQNSSLCEDVDLCQKSKCRVGCMETNGNTSFICLCNAGQKLANDGINCVDCMDGMWGVNCTEPCICEPNNTQSCNKVNGSCTCKNGWTGKSCTIDSSTTVQGVGYSTPGGKKQLSTDQPLDYSSTERTSRSTTASNGTAARPPENGDDDSLFLGLWIGLPLFALLCGVGGVIGYFLVKTRRKLAKANDTALERLKEKSTKHVTGTDNTTFFNDKDHLASTAGYGKEPAIINNPGFSDFGGFYGGGQWSRSWADNLLISRPASMIVPVPQMEMSEFGGRFYDNAQHLRDGMPRPQTTGFSQLRTHPSEFRVDYRMHANPRDNFHWQARRADLSRQHPEIDSRSEYQYHANRRASRVYEEIPVRSYHEETATRPHRAEPIPDY